jgi:hypothetical protein
VNRLRSQPAAARIGPGPATAALIGVALALGCGSARGDGGTLRLSENAGPYHLSVFTSPSPPRAGRLDVSVLVQDAKTGAFVPGAAVSVRVSSTARPGLVSTYAATHEAATNKLLLAAECEAPAAGEWRVAVTVDGRPGGGNAAFSRSIGSRTVDRQNGGEPAAQASAAFSLEVGEPAPLWWDMTVWIGWPALAVGLFGVHQILAARGRRPLRHT